MAEFNFGAGFTAGGAGDAFTGAYKQSRLAKLLGQGYNAPQEQRAGLLSQIAEIDPQAAQGMDQRFSNLDARAAQQLQQYAKLTHAAYKSGNRPAAESLYGQALALAKQVYPGFEAGPLDDQTADMLGQFAGIGDDTPAGVREFEHFAKGLTPEQRQQAQLAKLGIGQKEGPKYAIKEINGQLFYVPEQPMMGQPQAQNSPAANAAFDQHIKPLMQREGGFVANDAGAGPTNFGINSRANPDVDVRSLTPDAAQQIYKQRYWDAIGGDQLPPYLQAGAFDAAVNMGPAKAQELLRASGGDPAKFDQLRMQHYEGLARSNPQKYAQYLPSWRKRVQETSAMGGMQESYQDSASVALPAGAIPVPGLPKADKGSGDKSADWQIVQGQDGTFYRVNKITGEVASTKVQGANALRANDQHQKRAEAVSSIKGAVAATDQTIQQIDLLLNHPGRGSGTGMSAFLPAIPGSDRKGFDAQLATFKAQTFIPMVAQLKGMGALSDAEGRKLTEAVGALDPQMGEAEFAASLTRIKTRLYRAQKMAYDRISALNTNQQQRPATQQTAPANGGLSAAEQQELDALRKRLGR